MKIFDLRNDNNNILTTAPRSARRTHEILETIFCLHKHVVGRNVPYIEQTRTRQQSRSLHCPLQLLSKINKRKLNYLGHANRNTRTNMITAALQGNVERKRLQGRPSISYTTRQASPKAAACL